MKEKSSKEFDVNFIIKEYENEDNYDVIGCFKEPDYYSIAGSSYFFECDDEESVFNTTMDFEIFVSTEDTVNNVYRKLKRYIKDNNNIEDCVVFGIFLNGEKSCLVCSDYDYCYEMFLVRAVLENLNIKITDNNYLRKAHADKEEIEERFPVLYSYIKYFFHDEW